MLLSELEERERHFKFALRAGTPIVIFISLVSYSLFSSGGTIEIDSRTIIFFLALLFITIYFIFFLMYRSAKESLVDQTTQGFNQKTFIKKLEATKPQTLVLLIIENLSTISEHYSASEVDNLLYTTIHQLNQELNKKGLHKSIIARRYGAEFLIAINKNRHDIQKILQSFIEKHHQINGIELNYRFSVITNTHDDWSKTILHLKDLISTESKDLEKQTIVEDARKLSSIEENIIQAIEAKTLSLQFRPLYHIQKETIDIYEISVKLQAPQQGKILPRVYLPIVNRLGLGRAYDMALVEHVLKLLPLIDEKTSFSFNLSPFSLRDKTFQKQFFEALQKSHIDPSRLIIELYERKTHHNLSGYLQTLNQFRAKGVRIAIDNFGSSNASMEYMKHFKFDLVQFDRDYVSKLHDENTYAMLHSLVQMSKELHITTVAKWVDKESQKKELIALGFDYLQGFSIAKPINEEQLLHTYHTQRN